MIVNIVIFVFVFTILFWLFLSCFVGFNLLIPSEKITHMLIHTFTYDFV